MAPEQHNGTDGSIRYTPYLDSAVTITGAAIDPECEEIVWETTSELIVLERAGRLFKKSLFEDTDWVELTLPKLD